MPTDRIRNTADEDPLSLFVQLIGGASAGIERMEARGQAELVASEQLPVECVGASDDQLRALGFVLGPPCPDDPLFREAKLPTGWTKVAGEHAMWSSIVDERGRRRFGVFYKAAPYDRRARMQVHGRYSCSAYADGPTPGRWLAVVEDAGKVIATLGERDSKDYDAGQRLGEECREWLDARFPEWHDPMAYWEAP